jgi:hypothetical protein
MSAFARMVRKSCSQCGSASITWGHVSDLKAQRAVSRKVLKDIEQLGVMFGAGAEAWWCNECDEFGVFGPTEFSG